MSRFKVGEVVIIVDTSSEYYNMVGIALESAYFTNVLLVDIDMVNAFSTDDLEPYNKRIVILDGKLELISHWLNGGDIEFLHEGSWQDVDSPEVSVSVLNNFELRVKEPEKFQWVIDTNFGKTLTNGFFTEEEIRRQNPESEIFIKVPNLIRINRAFPGIPAKVEVIKV